MSPTLFSSQDIRITETPAATDRDAILATLRTFVSETVGPADDRPFAALLHDEQGAVIGGLIGHSRWEEFFIELLALPASLRSKGLGTALLERAEAEARARRCRVIWLDSYVFQNIAFYERAGYEVFSQIDGAAPIYPRLLLQKRLG